MALKKNGSQGSFSQNEYISVSFEYILAVRKSDSSLLSWKWLFAAAGWGLGRNSPCKLTLNDREQNAAP